jgi:solute carrier family 13 (sodium-dependent dicarboxylate transporter), member 2/3/5
MTGNLWRQGGRWLAVPLAIAAIGLANMAGDWPREQAYMAGILVLAAVLWVTEAVPLFVTSLVVIGTETILLANPGGWPGFGFSGGGSMTFGGVVAAAADPVLVLFFGGLVMASAAINQNVDQTMAAWLLRPFVASRRSMLYGVMGVTALFSMWMSNTATTAFMLTLMMPLLAQVKPSDPYRKALLLAVPFAANIGGLGTPIASPPNAIALGYLKQAGVQIGFLQWMVFSIPLMIVLIAVLGWLLSLLFPSGLQGGDPFKLPSSKLSPRGIRVVVIFVLTVMLWLSEGIHGLPSSVVALLPVLALLLDGAVSREDINRLEWDVLLLIGGGLALGYGLGATGLDARIVDLLPSGQGAFGLVCVLVTATFVLSTLISNSAVSNLLLPVGLAASFGEPHLLPVMLAIALTASLAMGLPVSTPPNAMAYARGELRAVDMAKAGIPIGLFGVGLILLATLLR